MFMLLVALGVGRNVLLQVQGPRGPAPHMEISRDL